MVMLLKQTTTPPLGGAQRSRSDSARIGGLARVNPANAEIREGMKIKAVALRMEGLSYRNIAKRLQVSHGMAHILCVEGISEEQNRGKKHARLIRDEQLDHLDEIQCRLSDIIDSIPRIPENVEGGAKVMPKAHFTMLLKAASVLLKVFDHQAKLMGLYATKGVEFDAPEVPNWAEIIARAKTVKKKTLNAQQKA